MNKEDIKHLFKKFEQMHVVVVGDIMLDVYWMGDVERVSPEAPVPVVNLKKRKYCLGGAANVALNCQKLGARVTLASVVGKDKAAEQIDYLCKENNIETGLIMEDPNRHTTTKIRVIGRHAQLLRIDEEDTSYLETDLEHRFIDQVLRFIQIEKPDVLIFEDYNKGLLKPNIIQKIVAHCKRLNILTAVDPKFHHFFDYKGVDIFKPNLKETREALQLESIDTTISGLNKIHQLLFEKLAHNISLITMSEKGAYISNGEQSYLQASFVRNIADVSGAGDTVMAVSAMTLAVCQSLEWAAQLGNLAGGLVCEQIGVVPVDKDQLLNEALKLNN